MLYLGFESIYFCIRSGTCTTPNDNPNTVYSHKDCFTTSG